MSKPRIVCLLPAVFALQACASLAGSEAPSQAFDKYRQQSLEWIQKHRSFQTDDHAAELQWNAPREWRPAGKPTNGILLVHGLGDSPWSFNDVGAKLAAKGFLVRTVLLPGHGTQPSDMLDVTLGEWQDVVREQARTLGQEVPKVYLGGFSTGANLVLDYAYDHDEIAGLLLFSPAFRSDSPYAWMTQWIAWARPWLASPTDPLRPLQTPVRYLNVPTNGFAQFYRSSVLAQKRLAQATYDKPVFIAVTEHDSVLDTHYILERFNQRFTHPSSRLIWYGNAPPDSGSMPRVMVRKDYLPEYRISQFSHMGLLFSPHNPLYGVDGNQRICWNGQETADMKECLAGEQMWYSDWGYREPGKVHARLTFNPYFEWQSTLMLEVLEDAGAVPKP